MEQAFGLRPIRAVLGLDLICVFEDENQVRSMVPDQKLLIKLEGRIQNATAKESITDCVSRSFCPKLSISEDPVCGSAHCQIADYWASALGKDKIYAYQASSRGGYLKCRLLGRNRITISGCIGDGENDLSLFQVSGLRFAMGNAAPALKQQADYILPSNQEDGVAEAISRYILHE